jgi:hypothetical protein
MTHRTISHFQQRRSIFYDAHDIHLTQFIPVFDFKSENLFFGGETSQRLIAEALRNHVPINWDKAKIDIHVNDRTLDMYNAFRKKMLNVEYTTEKVVVLVMDNMKRSWDGVTKSPHLHDFNEARDVNDVILCTADLSMKMGTSPRQFHVFVFCIATENVHEGDRFSVNDERDNFDVDSGRFTTVCQLCGINENRCWVGSKEQTLLLCSIAVKNPAWKNENFNADYFGYDRIGFIAE